MSPSIRSPRRLSAALGALLALGACRPEPTAPPVSGDETVDWPAPLVDLARRARDEFDAPTVSPGSIQLSEWTVVDVREARESEVSRLDGAILLPDADSRQRFLQNALAEPPERPVLVYCTAGWRSAEYTRALTEVGIEARNLEGGICAWAAGERPIESPSGEATRRIHAYSDQFADCVPASHEPVTD